jgi:DNA replication and repair protein RecF
MSSLGRLSLSDFRSYADALIAPGPGAVVLTGENGAGKTNVLEAVSLLSPGRGLRGAPLSEMARQDGAGGFAVAAQLSPSPEGEGFIELGTGIAPGAPERRQVRINGAPASATNLSEWLSVLWLTPAMDRLFQEGAGGRRRFLDRLVLALEPGHAVHAARYEAAMRARNKLLGEEKGADEAWLSALEARMAEHGAALAEARERTVAALGERLAASPEGPFARAGLALEGGDEDLERGLHRGRARDAAAGRTLIGPHRTDLAVTHLGKPGEREGGRPAGSSSTGEQKALLLSIVLAHADLVAERAGRRPILLLDEVAAHLDPRRRFALFERLEAGGGQVWMTGTEPALFDGLSPQASRWRIADGAIEADSAPS